jgi:hypothetical protein
MNRCNLCGCNFAYPEYEADKAFGELLGAEPGVSCDDCTQIILYGSAEDLERVQSRAKPCTN